MHTLRCSICDRTNNASIANLPGGFAGDFRRSFSKDENNPHLMLCHECKTIIEDTKREYFIDVDEDREDEIDEG